MSLSASTQQEFADMEDKENAAIDDFDYEQARFYHEAKKKMETKNVEEATKHYEQQLEDYKAKFEEILMKKKEENEKKYNEEVAAARERLRVRVNDISEEQKRELKELEERWREAREFQKAQIEKTVTTLLTSSQFLARSQKFDEAIEMRDKARALQKRKKHPQIEECDTEYNAQFQEMLLRHEGVLNEIVEQYDELMNLLEEKKEAADKAAEAECSIDNAYGTVEIMDIALTDPEHPETAIPVVQHFSPRAAKMRRQQSQLVADDELEEEEKEKAE